DHRDHRRERAQRGVLAEAGRDQVGDRGRVIDPADRHQLAQEYPPAGEHDRRAEIDRREFEAAARGRAHRAEERPGCAVYRDGKRVDERRRKPAGSAVPGGLVGGEGDREEDRDIAEADEDDEIGRQHQRGPLSPGGCSVAPACARPRDNSSAARMTAANTPKMYTTISGMPASRTGAAKIRMIGGASSTVARNGST